MFNEFISFLSAMMLKMFIQDYGHGVSDETDEIDLWASLTISASILAIVPMAVFIRFDSDLTMVRHQSRVALSVVLLTSGVLNLVAGREVNSTQEEYGNSHSTAFFILYSINSLGKIILCGMFWRAPSNLSIEKGCFSALFANEFMFFVGACAYRDVVGSGSDATNLLLASSVFGGLGLVAYKASLSDLPIVVLGVILSFAAGVTFATSELTFIDGVDGEYYYKAYQALLMMSLFGSRVALMIVQLKGLKPSRLPQSSPQGPSLTNNINSDTNFNVTLTATAVPIEQPNLHAAHIDSIMSPQLPVAHAVQVAG